MTYTLRVTSALTRLLSAAATFAVLVLLPACSTVPAPPPQSQTRVCTPETTVHAEVVALEQAYVLNRFGAYVPAGMLYALKRDVEPLDGARQAGPGNARLRSDKRPRPLVLRVNEGGCLQITLHNWLSPTWEEEGGAPPYPTMLVDGKPVPAAPAHLIDAAGEPTSTRLKPLAKTERDAPRTRSASLFVTGLESDPMQPDECPVNAVCGGDGTYVGLPDQQATVFNPATPATVRSHYGSGSLVAPGGVSVVRWIARREGTYFAHSMGAPVGGEGDGGQIGLGLFAAVNVEPPDSKWYRSQLTHEDLQSVLGEGGDGERHPYARLDYEVRHNGRPVLALVDGREIVHSDLNAIIVRDEQQRAQCTERLTGSMVDGQRCEPAFREFTVILHDEVHAQQAFPELEEESHPLHYLKDGMGINYGVSSMGSLVAAAGPQRGVGPAAKCPECRAEEFFLSSWASGDPALVLQWDARGDKPIGARYPDDPSNVHHSYLADPVVFRNLHAGPKETHVFHLHAHQWVLDASDPNSTYLDSQTISPGATFSYGIEFGGSGNRNFTPGDSIFHCHLYPHFAQGMWELWRVHDVFENGLNKGIFYPDRPLGPDNDPRSRSLPDGEIASGTAAPAIVPLPGTPLAPMPSAAFRGYPFYIPGEPGHRPPQPVLDMDVVANGYDKPAAYAKEPAPTDIVNGGLPRHVVRNDKLSTIKSLGKGKPGEREYQEILATALTKGGEAAQVIAQKVYSDHPLAFQSLAADWDSLYLKELKHSGEPSEQQAMAFHEGKLEQKGVSLAQGRLEPVDVAEQQRPEWWTNSRAYLTSFAPTLQGMAHHASGEQALFRVNGRGRAPGSPFANPCPVDAPQRDYRAAFIQTEITVNKHGWFDPQGRIVILEDDIKDVIDANRRTRLPEPLFFRANSGDCINFKSSNFVPSALNADDFQIYTPTDTIGQHIHLVKFDVTSSDGSGNGWNYEDSTFSPDEVRERIVAFNRSNPAAPALKPRVHPLFRPTGSIALANTQGQYDELLTRGQCPDRTGGESDHDYLQRLGREHPYCGAQRTTQRWWADPILVRSGPQANKDNTLRTIFTHDHMGPSSHQQHGLYAALVIEPANSVWQASAFDATGGAEAVRTRCVDTRLADVAKRLGIKVNDKAAAARDEDHAVYVAFTLRASPKADAAGRALAEGCLQVALLGGSDLSKAPVTLVNAGADQLAPVQPRPVFHNRADGGPTSTRATIISPACIGDANSSPLIAGAQPTCASGRDAQQSRREFALAFADFAGVYNAALEPINPETPRDVSMRRFGERQVATRAARPIAISSEDPGTQLINYRHEPLALRIADVKWNAALGGFDYAQTQKRADGSPCVAGATDCLGDMANGFSSYVHSRRDRELATQPYLDWVRAQSGGRPNALIDLASPRLRGVTPQPGSTAWLPRLGRMMAQVEGWRQDFNCSLYAPAAWLRDPDASGSGSPFPATGASPFPSAPGAAAASAVAATSDAVFDAFCAGHYARARKAPMQVREPWRVFGDPATPVLAAREGDALQIRLIQGAQEAQHVFTMNGVKWHRLPDSPNSGFVNAQPLGISEHFEFDVRVPTLEVPHADYLYFGSSVDQLWDGMWGVLRAYKDSATARGTPPKLATGQTVFSNPRDWLVGLPGSAATQDASWSRGTAAVCQQTEQGSDAVSVKSFEVGAVQACQLTGSCGQPGQRGLSYSDRFGLADPRAVVYVLHKEAECTRAADRVNSQGCFDGMGSNELASNQAVLDTLKGEFAHGRLLEPLVLRAAAGQCITVKLRNLLPQALPVMARSEPVPEHEAYYNFLPMIADGFNLNQFAMSHTVGLSAPRVAQNPLSGDGSNAGLNSAALQATKAAPDRTPVHQPGSLVAPCSAAQAASATGSLVCKHDYVWSASDLVRSPAAGDARVHNRATEFGALPLRSFGDVVKHPAHGLVGALVIGPQGSQVCKDDPRAFPGGVSRHVCTADGKRYGDHVLVMQDAVSALQGGFPVPDLSGAEEPDDYGVKAINYKTEPLWARRGGSPSVEFGERNANFDYTHVFSSKKNGDTCESGAKPNGNGPKACDPETVVIDARAGESLRLHFVHPGGHTRQQGLTISGHGFHPYPWSDDSHVLNTARCWPVAGAPLPAGCLLWQGVFNGFAPMMGQTLSVRAGGTAGLAKDYLVRSQASFLLDGGLWGILRVTP